MNTQSSQDNEPTLAGVQAEFPSWRCWQDICGIYYARRQHNPHHDDYDAHGEDPADLREAILLALTPDERHARQAAHAQAASLPG